MTYYAALTKVDLDTACERLARRFSLPPFSTDVEFEGEDGWEYATSNNERMAFNLSKVLEFHRPELWMWMWGTPTKANMQVFVRGNDGSDLHEIERAISEALECTLEPYPAEFSFARS
jgi:hypothetical protein